MCVVCVCVCVCVGLHVRASIMYVCMYVVCVMWVCVHKIRLVVSAFARVTGCFGAFLFAYTSKVYVYFPPWLYKHLLFNIFLKMLQGTTQRSSLLLCGMD